MAVEDLFSHINKAEDMDNLSDLEKKHLPIIDTPDSVEIGTPFEVTIEVGKLLKHPNEVGHHIQWIALYQGALLLAKVDLIPVLSEPKVKLTIVLERSNTLKALARCNLHGEWEYTKDIEVK